MNFFRVIFSKMLLFILIISIVIPGNIIQQAYADDNEVPYIFIDNNTTPIIFTRGKPYYSNSVKDILNIPIKQFVEYIGGAVIWESEYRVLTIIYNDKIILEENIDSENSSILIKNEVSYMPLTLLTRKLGYTYTSEGKRIRLYSNPIMDQKSSRLMPLPNAFTPYANSNEFLKSSPNYGLDSKGVLIYNYGSNYNAAGRQYNPAWICLYAFTLYKDFLDSGCKDQTLKNKFLIQADWLVDNRKDIKDFSVWEYNFDNTKFGAYSPWRSAMANGRVISVMLEAYAMTGLPKYLNIAERAYKSFGVDTKTYGVATFLDDGNAYYEEVADNEAPSSKVLNGHIFSLSGLYDYWISTGRKDVKRTLDMGIIAVKNDLDKYDAGYLSYYSQEPDNPRIFAEKGGYNAIHVLQLLWLYEISNDPAFLEKAIRFYGYELVDYDITAKGSTDPQGHGLDKLDMRMGLNYWSHNEFPTWVKIDMKKPKKVNAVSIIGHTEKSAPKDMDIWYSKDNINWELAIKVRDSNQKIYTAQFSNDTEVQYLRIEILNDNGNNNVALDGIGVISPEQADLICDFNNFSISNYPNKAIDDNPSSKFYLRNDGWLLLLNNNGEIPIGSLSLESGVKGEIKVLGSNDLKLWSTVTENTTYNDNNVIDFNYPVQFKYIKLILPSELKWVNNIKLH